MQQLVVFSLGIGLLILVLNRRSWNAFTEHSRRWTSFEAKIPTQTFARRLGEDEELRDAYERFFRILLLLVGVGMTVGSILFIVQHGLGSG